MTLTRISVLLATLLLASCGFTLRGTADLPRALQPLYLENVNDSTPMGRELRRTLLINKVALADKLQANGYSLSVGNESSSERALSVNSNARAGEYEVIMTVPYQLKKGGASVQPQQSVSIGKVYVADPENAVAKTEEANIIRDEMRSEISQQILRRLQAYKP
ncbi:MAG TPA: LPS assembly lipoprotein LptE [Candidatus Acidoferrum sp.]|nr:LPS assembly lipoprotein LptE [Candidatus Acidoferrum sp.]